MSETLLVALFQLIAKVGLTAAINIMENLGKAVTIDDAIAALKKAQAKTWEDYKAGPTGPLPPT